MSNAYTDARDKLIPEAVRRTEQQYNADFHGNTVPEPYAAAFLRHMDDLARENWLTSQKGLAVDKAALKLFMELHGILPNRAGKVVINCGPKSVGSVDFVGAV